MAFGKSQLTISSSSNLVTTFGGDIVTLGSIDSIGPSYEFEAAQEGVTGYSAHAGDALALGVFSDASSAYTDGMSRVHPEPTVLAPDMHGSGTLGSGIYSTSGNLSVQGVIALDALNNSDAVFVFQVGGSLTMQASIVLVNEAAIDNVYWFVGGSVEIIPPDFTAGDSVKGTFIARGGAVVNTGSFIQGQIVSLDSYVSITESSLAMVRRTAPPSSAPSSMPTSAFNDFWDKPIYQRYVHNSAAAANATNTLSFNTFTYKGHFIEGASSDFNQILANNLELPVDNLYFARIFAHVEYAHFAADQDEYFNSTATCTDLAKVDYLIGLLRQSVIGNESSSSFTVNCDGNRWSVFTCMSSVHLCVNCETKADPCSTITCPGTNPHFLSPLYQGSCDELRSASTGVLGIVVGEHILYPRLNSALNVTATRTSMAVSVNVTLPGTIFCAALKPGTVVQSSFSIKQFGFSAVVLEANTFANVVISSLSPNVQYGVCCYTEGFAYHGMPLSLVQQSKVTVTTPCCRSLQMTSSVSEIVAVYPSAPLTSADIAAEIVFTFSLNTIPTDTATVSVSVAPIACPSSSSRAGFLQSAVATPFPSSFVFTNASKVLSNGFKIRGHEGCYRVDLSSFGGSDIISGTSIEPYLYIRNLTSAANAPKLVSATFSNDGRLVSATFNTPTDRGEADNLLNFDKTFVCMDLFEFAGASGDGSVCQWLSSKVIQISRGSVAVGSPLVLLPGKLKAMCPVDINCTNYPSNGNGSWVPVTVPATVLNPTPLISTAPRIGGCDDILLDTTLSHGHGGRPWASVQWEVSGEEFTVNPIKDTLMVQSQYGTTTSKLLRVPNALLGGGDITFTLTVVNFLGGISVASATVTVSADTRTPTISISGSSTLTVTRPTPINLFAIVSVPTCEGEVSKAVTYQWKVFSGISYIPSLTNSARDPRTFKLSGYQLESNSKYVIQVTASLDADPSRRATASVTVLVGSSGVKATIAGGGRLSISTAVLTEIDASQSEDLDYPHTLPGYTGASNPITFTWECLEISPVYGNPCSLTLPSTGKLTIQPRSAACTDCLKLAPYKEFQFTVFVASGNNFPQSASINVATTYSLSPVVVLDPIPTKFNVDSKVIVSAEITGVYPTEVGWLYDGAPVPGSMSLAPSSRLYAAGTNRFELALASNIFLPGVSYQFELYTSYGTGGALPSTSTIKVLMNAAPEGGTLTADPTEGIALNTSFTLLTADWVDDPADYPLLFVISYYSTNPSKQTVLKSSGVMSYLAGALIGQGVESDGYATTCFVSATDTYGGKASTTTSIIVHPVADVFALAGAMSGQFGAAFESGDVGLVGQLVGGLSTSLNSADCSAAPNCSTINRKSCFLTAATCSACLDGFLGSAGDSNTPCSDPKALLPVGSACSVDSECLSGTCSIADSGGIKKCSEGQKACKIGSNGQECSGSSNGVCEWFKLSGQPIVPPDVCYSSSVGCTVACSCKGDRVGDSCSFAASELDSLKSMREQLCESMYQTQNIQDITPDVVASRATSIGSILANIDQISDTALANCASSLAETVSAAVDIDPEYVAANPSVVATISDAFSNTLSKGGSSPTVVLDKVNVAMAALNAAVQGLMVAGEPAACTPTDNINVCASKTFGANIAGESYSPAQSALDLFNNVPKTAISVGLGASRRRLADTLPPESIVDVSVVQATNNPHGVVSNSTSVTLTVTSTGDDDSITSVIVLQNIEPIDYSSVLEEGSSVSCEITGSAYSVVGACSRGSEVTLLCPGDQTGSINYTCPEYRPVPQCTFWSEEVSDFVVNQACTVLNYTSTNTTCSCTSGSGSGGEHRRYLIDSAPVGFHHPNSPYHMHHRRFMRAQQADMKRLLRSDDEGSRGVLNRKPGNRELILESRAQLQRRRLSGTGDEYASQASIVGSQFVERWQSVTKLDFATLKKNLVVFGVVLSLLGSTLAGLFSFLVVDVWDIKTYVEIQTKEEKEHKKELRKIFGFFQLLLPDEFSDEPWLRRLYRKLMTEHDYFSLFTAYTEDQQLRSLKWVCGMGNIINFLFVDTILAGLFFDDGGVCATYQSKDQCLQSMSLDQMNTLCDWTPNAPESIYGVCSFEGPSDDFLAQCILTLIITTCAVPLNILVHRCTHTISDLVKSVQVRTSSNKYKLKDLEETEIGDELKDVQNMRNTFLRAARITKMKEQMDHVSAEQELDFMFEDHRRVLKRAALHFGGQRRRAGDIESASVDEARQYGRLIDCDSADRSDVLTRLTNAREEAAHIGQQVSLLKGEDTREIYLIQQFLVCTLKGVSKYIAGKIMFEHIDSDEERADKWLWRLCVSFFLPVYFSACALYILLFGVSIGQKSTVFWLVGASQAFAMDVFILQPVKIWMQKIAITAIAGGYLQKTHALLRDRSISIMKRTEGLMRYSGAKVQHFNAACRVARMYPELPAARLIMSLSDFDLPLYKFFNSRDNLTKPWVMVTHFVMALALILLGLLALCPEFMQESLVEVFCCMAFNFAVYILYVSVENGNIIPIGATLGLAGVIVAHHYWYAGVREESIQQLATALDDKVAMYLNEMPKDADVVRRTDMATSRVMKHVLGTLPKKQKPQPKTHKTKFRNEVRKVVVYSSKYMP